MNILLVSHFFPPMHNAGAEKRALGYAKALLAMGHRVQVVCAGEWESGAQYWNGYRDEVYQGAPVRRVQLNWSAAPDPNRYLYDNPVIEARLEEWLEEWKPDVAHVISLLTLSASVVRALKRRGIPVVFTLTDFWLVCPKISLVRADQSLCDGQVTAEECLHCLMAHTKAYRLLRAALPKAQAGAALAWISRRPRLTRLRGLRGLALDTAGRRQVIAEMARQVDCFTAPSTFLARTIEATGVLPQPVRVIHSGHDLSWLEHMPARQPSSRVRFGYIGQITPVKGLEVLIRAFQAAGGPAELRIYGDERHDPAYAARLKAMIRPGDAIHFAGPFPHERLGEALAEVDVLVVPSQWHENNPRVIQEAFAGKTPVIASDVGGITEFVRHGVNGLLFRRGDSDDLRAQMQRVIDAPEIVARLRQGIGSVKTVAQEMESFVEIYAGLVCNPAQRTSFS